jgi:hypothetical protein
MIHYRYNLLFFVDKEEFARFLAAVAKETDSYHLLGRGSAGGRELLAAAAGGAIPDTVLTGEFVANLPAMHGRLREMLVLATGSVEKVFQGKPFSWNADAGAIIDSINNLVTTCGPHLPNMENVMAEIAQMFTNMQKQDLYAFIDNIICMEYWCGHFLNIVEDDLRTLSNGCAGHE